MGLPGNQFAAAAQLVTESGWPTTAQNVKDAKRRGTLKLGAITDLTDAERDFFQKVHERWPEFDAGKLLKPGVTL